MPTQPSGPASAEWDVKAAQVDNRKWYRRPAFLVIAALALVLLIAGIAGAATGSKSGSSPHVTTKVLATTTTTRAPVTTTTTLPPTTTTTLPPTTTTTAPPPPPTTAAPAPPPAAVVPAPAPAPAVAPGNGATALCNDGTYSYAAHHQGACSHHGGVAVFYK
jgi:hypothetical protein